MANFNGYLFSKLGAVGTKSEGPVYFLQHFDSKNDYSILKHATLFQKDEMLHPFLNTKVSIVGDLVNGMIEYRSISPLSQNPLPSPSIIPNEPDPRLIVSEGMLKDVLRDFVGLGYVEPVSQWENICGKTGVADIYGCLERNARMKNIALNLSQSELQQHIEINPTEPFGDFVKFFAGHLEIH
jgi:hypothetical protein